MKSLRSIIPTRVALPLLAAAGLAGSSANAASYSETVLADQPTAYYRFEDAANSSSIVDSSPSGTFSGTVNSDDLGAFPKFEQPGLGSNSVSFHLYTDSGNSQKSFISIPDRYSYTPELNQAGPFTIEAWARASSFGGAGEYRSPVCNFGGWDDSTGWFFYQSPDVNGTSSWIWVQKGGGIWVGGVAVRKNQWDYLVASFDGTTVRFYVNGEFAGSDNASSALPNSGKPFCIGGDEAGNWWFDGNVDEVALYTTALSVEQIKTHYEAGLTNFYNGPIPASITKDPDAATAYAGHTVTFLAGSDGTAPLSYQWYKGSTAIPDGTSDTLSFVCQDEDNNATYKVTVTNAYGSASSAQAKLTVMRDLLLLSSPASITRSVGSAAAFIAVPDGALPVSYQWYKGSTAIPAATNQTLWLHNVQASEDNTAYYAQIRNTWFTTNSEGAKLTVVARSTTVPITGYARVVMNDEPVAYWRLDETDASFAAVDAAGSFDGEFDALGSGAFAPGEFTFGAGSGIPNETNKSLVVTNGARVKIPYALELNPHGAFSAEAWIMPSSVANDAQDYRTVFSSLGSGPTGWLLYQQPNNRFTWVVFNDNWVSSFIGDGQDEIQANQWYHIALTHDELFHIYVNGHLAVSASYELFIPNRDGATHLGWRSDNGWNPFAGTIDDVAFYDKALTLEQVQAHYLATVRLSVSQSSGNLILSWPFGMLQQADQATGIYTDVLTPTSPYTPVLAPYTNTPSGTAKFYRVKVQ